MRAVVCEAFGEPETLSLKEWPNPEPGPGEILIAMQACALNFPDGLVVQGKYQIKPPLPFAPGSEIAGVVRALGPGVDRWRVGDRVIHATGVAGGLAEEIVAPAAACHALPLNWNFAEGAGFLVTNATALHALKDRACLNPGETVLVLGAGGGVGLATIEVAKIFGARVIAAASTERKAALARRHGADAALIYGRSPLTQDARAALLADVRSVCKDGVDVIVDPLGGDYAETLLRAMNWGGRYLVVGFASGIIPRPPLNLALLKGCAIVGVSVGAFSMRGGEAPAANTAALLRWAAEGKLTPAVTQIFPMTRAAEALRLLLDGRAEGKIVVTP